MFEVANPALKSLPLAVQQKQIIVTCNYEARRRGLHKLQLITEARSICPDVIIVLGEDLTRFRNASKELYTYLCSFSWNQKAERLGFDEVFLDFTDVIDYNVELLNHNDLRNSWFHLDKDDPTVGFHYSATDVCGNTFPASVSQPIPPLPSSPGSPRFETVDTLTLRLRLASHLGNYLRHQLKEYKGYTSTVGISTNKLLSKLVGNVNKPKNQTTLVPPYVSSSEDEESNVVTFIDNHDIGKIPGIGFKLSQKIREFILGRAADFDAGLIYGGTQEDIKVKDVRLRPDMSPALLEEILGGPGSPKGIGLRIWGLINGVDDSEVGKARIIPRQISMEDSYVRLDTIEEVKKQLRILAERLIHRMHLDLTSVDDGDDTNDNLGVEDRGDTIRTGHRSMVRRWAAHPTTLRLTTRPRPPRNADGTRTRTFNRISRSGPMPSFVFSSDEAMKGLVEKFVVEALIPLFKKLHSEKSGWNLSLVNIAATNIVMVASDDKDHPGRNIGTMFRTQLHNLQEWKMEDVDVAPSSDWSDTVEGKSTYPSQRTLNTPRHVDYSECRNGSEEEIVMTQASQDIEDSWDSTGDDLGLGVPCTTCGAIMPPYASTAHERFHMNPD